MAERKSATNLTDDERDSLLAAVLNMKATTANPSDPPNQQISVFDQFEAIHIGCLRVTVPSGSTVNMGHQGPAFLPWHREFLLRFEKALVASGSIIGLPYWDWTDHKGTSDMLFVDEFLGGGGVINRGYFAFDAPGTSGNTLPAPAWWPAGLDGWRIKASLSGALGTTLQRRQGLDTASLTVPEDIRRLMRSTVYHDPGDPIGGLPTLPRRGFWNRLEAGPRLHNFGHGWVGGHMADSLTSPNDLIFFFHHCNIDRLWAEWQADGHAGAPFYPDPASGEAEGHKLTDAMWPWIGSRTQYTPNLLPDDAPIPDFTGENEKTPADVIDMSVLDYVYL